MNTAAIRSALRSQAAHRLLACLAGAFVFALMWGPQEGSQTDFGLSFRNAVFKPRIFVFLAMGVLAFVLITFWPKVKPFLTRPGVWPLTSGTITVLAAQTLMRWHDQAGTGKFGDVHTAATALGGLSPLATAFFNWLAWAQLLVIFVLGGVAIVLNNRLLAWLVAGLSVVAAVLAYVAHASFASLQGGIDHSLGVFAAMAGYAVVASAGASVALTKEEVARTRAFLESVLHWRPGLPIAAAGAVLGLFAMASATWYSPLNLNLTLADTHNQFLGTDLNALAVQYLAWLGWVLLAVSAIASVAGAYLRNRVLGWVGAGTGLAAVLITLVSMYQFSSLGARQDATNGSTWQNLGAGGWVACIALFLVAAGGYLAATDRRPGVKDQAPGEFRTKLASSGPSDIVKAAVIFGIAMALFFPPTATPFWQKVLVSEIGVYVLLTVGLNVVVGWAGLLDLGFIAFYAIGSYTTAYLVGALPVKPPSWLEMTPLLAIPFAIVICLLAGLALGAPTLRLRGDYLAIVTLGFGEIIRIIAVNNPGNITNGPRGATNIPHPVVDVGPVKIHWSLNQLQYWYLLLIFIVVVVLLFYRLENSRLGRAWAAIREDEVAAQATGVNTMRIKLLAFAIGASTSGLAGVFFASQIGYINPDNFVLNNSILVVAYVVFGGMGSLPGAMAGAAMLTWMPEFLKDQVPADDRQMWIGAVVLLMMIFRPAGLIPAKRRKAELSGLDDSASAETRAVPASEGM